MSEINPRSKKILLRVLFFINAIFLLLLVIGNLAGRTDPAKWWPVSIAGLLFPVLLLIAFISCIFWLFVKRKYALVCLAAILLSIPNIIVSFPANVSSGLDNIKNPTELRVVSWNVNLMNYSAKDDATAIRQNEKIFNTLYDLNADVICLQEFFTAVIPDKTYNFIDSFRNRMGYSYHYFSRDFAKFDAKFYSGTIIFSRHKIVDSSRVNYPSPILRSIIKAGILYQGDTVDVVSTHLQNLNIAREVELKGINYIPPESRVFPDKLKYTFSNQMKQVKTIREILDASKRPLVFTADLNNIPTSYTYRNIKSKMKDAWLERGAGLGATYKIFARFLRIDFIFFNEFFDAVNTQRIVSDASDHYGIVTDLQLKQK